MPVKFRECPDCTDRVRVKNDGLLYKHRCDKPVTFDVCEACGKRVPLDGEGVMTRHFRDTRDPDSECDGSPAEPETCGSCGETEDRHGGVESACYWSPGPAPFGGGAERGPLLGDPGIEIGFTRNRPVSDPPATVESMDDTPKPDPFDTPATVDKAPEPEINVSGQPEPKRDQWGRYLLPHPVTGLYSDGKAVAGRRNGWTRATTFAKAAADTFSLTRYDERLTLVGATLRPDVVALAHGKQVREDAKELNQLVLQVKDAAGAKVAANHGTAVHGFTERVDAGLMHPMDVPPAYRAMVWAYQEELEKYGLEPVQGLIERTVFVDQWSGVVGTLDRVLYHRASGTYLIGDVKTGRDLRYGRMEIAVQLALYAHGINAHGVYDWASERWQPVGSPMTVGPHPDGHPIRVRTDYGVVMHLPIQGEAAGTCTLKRINLAAGWDAAQVCANVLSSRKRDDYMDDGFELPSAPYVPETPAELPPAELPPAEPMPWEGLFGLVQSKEDASALWSRAKEEGVDRMELQRLVGLAQQRLRSLGVSG